MANPSWQRNLLPYLALLRAGGRKDRRCAREPSVRPPSPPKPEQQLIHGALSEDRPIGDYPAWQRRSGRHRPNTQGLRRAAYQWRIGWGIAKPLARARYRSSAGVTTPHSRPGRHQGPTSTKDKRGSDVRSAHDWKAGPIRRPSRSARGVRAAPASPCG